LYHGQLAGVQRMAIDLETWRERGDKWWLEAWRASSASMKDMGILAKFD
jgi:hypothetical protein